MSDYVEYFREATRTVGYAPTEPYPYQIELANIPIASRMLKAPTGAGKTAAVILAWLYRLRQNCPDAPRRMAYCLPMRVLVEQTRDKANQWIARVAPGVQVATLMGGESDEGWEIHPEKPCLLIGTQDMLLSRALNRGYALSRYRWPAHFGLLNNDCLWVCDEVQLMGNGLATSTQLDAFRERIGVFGVCPTIWMSATMDAPMLRSVDVSKEPEAFGLTEQDFAREDLNRRLQAVKHLAKAPQECGEPAGLAQFLLNRHRPGMQTIAVVNRVDRARKTYDELRKISGDTPCHLLHSRFRPWERRAWRDLLESPAPPAGRILIATQVIEAGVDISSAVLVTDLAPWPSLIQRFGRCNRAGELETAEIYWVALEIDPDSALPYEPKELREAESKLEILNSASLVDLPEYGVTYSPSHVLRRRDLIDLFDTTSDLSGYDLDVSRFIRSEQDRDVLIAWRTAYPPATKDDAPSRDELCAAPLHEVVTLLRTLKKGRRFEAVTWNALTGEWRRVTGDILRPGMVLIANAKSGGYDVKRGWDPEFALATPEAGAQRTDEESNDDEPGTFLNYTQTLVAHSREVRTAARLLSEALSALDLGSYREALLTAALYHDWGKAHPVFQETLNPGSRDALLAKSQRRGRHKRKRFRHELASALALLQAGAPDLAVYLAAAHHGKVRLSIRALPDEDKPETAGIKFARGMRDGDILIPAQLDDVVTGAVTLDLEPMLLGASANGKPSWMERMLDLRDTIGVFRLAYLEALIVAADWRASQEPKEVLA